MHKAAISLNSISGMISKYFYMRMAINPDPQEAAWLDGLAADFVASGWDFPALARAIVTSPTYRRVR